ncbi:sugar O-acetyltransferase [Herbiconiux moechotypicola]|uniref:Acetyltransferase n=1 Tax=Herbiconiux moechotypicola TaxID=637393 RepID=A0ABP5QY19_9MICO|nr:sugar O-acetyltransferase [Herbiconiux moechotypicola]
MDNLERMHSGRIYDPNEPELAAEQTAALELLYDFNATRPSESARRTELLGRMFGSLGADCYIEPPLHANWAGRHVHLGDRVYANFGLTLVDDTTIRIGDRVMFGPNVTITTAGHPVDPELRSEAAQFNLPVTIGSNVWIGAGALIMPGVSIGDDSVIGAGSVVTRDIPAGVVALGAPCRVVREIGEHDREFYWRDRRIDLTLEEYRALRAD